MKNYLLGLALLACIAGLAYAGDDYAGQTVTSTGTNACSTALTTMTKYSVQCDAAARIHLSTDGVTDVATTNDVKVGADVLYDVPTTGNQKYICVISVSGTANCKLYRNRNTRE